MTTLSRCLISSCCLAMWTVNSPADLNCWGVSTGRASISASIALAWLWSCCVSVSGTRARVTLGAVRVNCSVAIINSPPPESPRRTQGYREDSVMSRTKVAR